MITFDDAERMLLAAEAGWKFRGLKEAYYETGQFQARAPGCGWRIIRGGSLGPHWAERLLDEAGVAPVGELRKLYPDLRAPC